MFRAIILAALLALPTVAVGASPAQPGAADREAGWLADKIIDRGIERAKAAMVRNTPPAPKYAGVSWWRRDLYAVRDYWQEGRWFVAIAYAAFLVFVYAGLILAALFYSVVFLDPSRLIK